MLCSPFILSTSAFADDTKHFVRGLKTIAQVLLKSEGVVVAKEEEGEQTPLTISGMCEFVGCAEELFDLMDINADQYVALLGAILSAHPAVLKLFDLYGNPGELFHASREWKHSMYTLLTRSHLRRFPPRL